MRHRYSRRFVGSTSDPLWVQALAIGILVLFFVALYLGLMAIAALIWGWVWNTLVVLIFPDLPTLNFWQSLALAFIVSLIGGGVRMTFERRST